MKKKIKAFTLAEVKKNISLATFRGRGIKGEGASKKTAFTLAEVLIVLAVLGIVAMIVVPPVIKKYQEAAARTKLKKAMTIYDGAIMRMTIENDLKTGAALKSWADEGGNCDNPIMYFKALDRTACSFKTADGVYWDITDIMNPIVALSKKDLEKVQNGAETDGVKSFKLATSYDANLGTFRVDDIAFEKARLESELAQAQDEETKAEIKEKLDELEKLYNFTHNNNKNIDSSRACSKNTTISCTKYSSYVNTSTPIEILYDNNGNISKQIFCENEECTSYSINYYDADFPHEYIKQSDDPSEYSAIANKRGYNCSSKEDYYSCQSYSMAITDSENPSNLYILLGCDSSGNANNCKVCLGHNNCPDKYKEFSID